ncbi:gastrula zinc finger protein XlCGF7.1-like [Nilaparvata lugens]|uniref:gastrula zinc finger protein XlCGF7.1-like n=1 Tax=Nilaparvata lugens TaxID=108931 RepID=UPI00193CA86C|nr:gastrula zinc finger protein XlCGF7.1-like [Nilaparvata lugens]
MERPFRCDYNCGKVFASKRSMERHVRSSHTGERPYACTLCPKRFADRSNHRRHIKRHEPKPVVEHSDEGEAVVDSVVVNKVSTRREAREVKPDKAIVISNNETVAVERHTTQNYSCRVCTFSDASMEVVEEHQKTHRVFKCRSCGMRFTDKQHLLEHKRREHLEEKPFICGVCGKAFKRRDVMQRHEKLHSSTDRFECSYCGKQFATRPSLITHEKKHSGVRPYLCSQCSCMFTEKGCLLRHERAVHSSERPFMCSQCPKTFALKNNLVRHERSHLPIRMVKCGECDMTFKEKTNLLRHRKRVHGYVTPKSVFEYVNGP